MESSKIDLDVNMEFTVPVKLLGKFNVTLMRKPV